MSAQTTVVTVGAGVATLAVLDAARGGRAPETRRLLGTLVGTFALSALANGAPVLAARLALLWATTSVIVSGTPTLRAITTATTTTTTPAASQRQELA